MNQLHKALQQVLIRDSRPCLHPPQIGVCACMGVCWGGGGGSVFFNDLDVAGYIF